MIEQESSTRLNAKISHVALDSVFSPWGSQPVFTFRKLETRVMDVLNLTGQDKPVVENTLVRLYQLMQQRSWLKVVEQPQTDPEEKFWDGKYQVDAETQADLLVIEEFLEILARTSGDKVQAEKHHGLIPQIKESTILDS